MLLENVEDDPSNETRFVWIAPAGTEPVPGDRFKTALVFWGAGSSGPGWLVRCLAEFASRDVNLTRIESRPLRQGLGEYMFFLDFDGRDGDLAVADAVAGLRAHADVRACARLVSSGLNRPALWLHCRAAMGSSTPVPPLGSVPHDDHQRYGSNTDGTGRWSGGRVLVLNATYEPINVCTVRRATVLLLKEKAEVIEIGATDLHWATGSLPKPGRDPARHLRPRPA